MLPLVIADAAFCSGKYDPATFISDIGVGGGGDSSQLLADPVAVLLPIETPESDLTAL